MVLTDPKPARRCADTLVCLVEPTRIRILDVLRTGPKNVTELAKALKVEIVNVSHHLSVLRHAGLVETRKDGRFVVYALDPEFADGKGGLGIDLGWCKVKVVG